MQVRYSSFNSVGHAAGRQITRFGKNEPSCKECANLLSRVAREELPQVLARFAQELIIVEQTLDGVRNLAGYAAIAHGPRDRLVFAYSAADTEVIGVNQPSVLLDLLAFKTEIGNPVLTATVGASGDMKL